jgi:hypothetical protein
VCKIVVSQTSTGLGEKNGGLSNPLLIINFWRIITERQQNLERKTIDVPVYLDFSVHVSLKRSNICLNATNVELSNLHRL